MTCHMVKYVCGKCGYSWLALADPEECPGCKCHFDEPVMLEDNLTDEEMLAAIHQRNIKEQDDDRRKN